MERLTIPQTVAESNQSGKDSLPGYLGMEFLAVEPDEVIARMHRRHNESLKSTPLENQRLESLNHDELLLVPARGL
jgi:hypothetical protein